MGAGGPVIAILGEYDALPGLGQVPGVAEPRPLGDFGHGCGHNLLGSAAMLAAVALRDWLAASGLPGRVRYYGCPAEEGGAAKTFMVRAGCFADVDAAVTWHPLDYTGVMAPRAGQYADRFRVHRHGGPCRRQPGTGPVGAGCGGTDERGVNYLREHMPDGCRLHYAYQDAGARRPMWCRPMPWCAT